MDNFSEYMKNQMNGIFSILSIHIQAKASKTAITLQEYISVLRQNGLKDQEIKNLLFQDIADQGRIFGEFFNNLNADVRGAMNNVTHSAKWGRMMPGSEEMLIWEVDSEDPCPDCLKRDGETDTFQNWQIRGLPGSGWSVCRENCLCNLVKTKKMAAV